MSQNKKIGILLLIAAALVAGGKYSVMMFLALLMPVYAWLLSSVILLIFIALAMVVVPIGQKLAERHEAPGHVDIEDQGQRRVA